jgi:hypothetical protein
VKKAALNFRRHDFILCRMFEPTRQNFKTHKSLVCRILYIRNILYSIIVCLKEAETSGVHTLLFGFTWYFQTALSPMRDVVHISAYPDHSLKETFFFHPFSLKYSLL